MGTRLDRLRRWDVDQWVAAASTLLFAAVVAVLLAGAVIAVIALRPRFPRPPDPLRQETQRWLIKHLVEIGQRANVAVRACETSGCTTPVDVTTGADGLAAFHRLGRRLRRVDQRRAALPRDRARRRPAPPDARESW